MKKLLMLLLLLGNIALCSAQTKKIYINATQFKTLKNYTVISSNLLDTTEPDGKAAMEVKILDYADQKIKYYIAHFNKDGNVVLPSGEWLPASIGNKKNYINRAKFDSLEHYTVMSTSTLEATEPKGKAALEVKILDHSDQKIKYYTAQLEKNGYVGFSTKKWLPTSFGNFSIMTVPFKVRSRNSQGQVTAKADIKNVGVYLPVYLWDYKRYWLDNATTNHKFSIGILIAPMAEDLTDANTDNYFTKSPLDANGKAKQPYTAFMLSTSIAATYSYKNITLALIPAGFDFGMDKAGKNWINDGRYWFGFAVGVDTKLFGF
jgi:hypothetical protein